MALLILAAGCLGLLVGSFLNVVVHRVPRHESVLRPASHCPRCLAPVRARHNVPVLGWLVLRGRCAGCALPISVRYPLIEALTGALFAAVMWRLGPTAAAPAYLYLVAVGVALSAIDLDVRRLPDVLVLPSYLAGGALLAAASVLGDDYWALARAAAGLGILWILYYAMALAYPSGMGYGDVKLAGLLGMYLGWAGWGPLILGGFGAFAAGSVVALGAAARRRTLRRVGIPFGPCMVAAAICGLFVGGPVLSWYGALAGLA